MSEQAYAVVEGSQSCHCCFEATVVDRRKPVMLRGEHYMGRYEPVCECLDMAEAKMITDALNAAERTKNIG